MRIAIVYDCLYPHTVGGAERWLRALAEALSEEHQVSYVTRRQWGAGDRPVSAARCVAVAPGGPLYADDGRRLVWPGLRFGAGVFVHFVRRRGAYDVVHCGAYPFFGVLAVRAALLGRRTPRIFVDWAECLGAAYWRSYAGPIAGRAGHALQTLSVRLTPAAFCFSRLVEQRLRRSALRGPVVRLPGLLVEGDGAAPPGEAVRQPLVLFAGRHVPDKRTQLLADAVARAREQLPELRAVFVGDGPERPLLLERLRADEWIRAPGFVDERELGRLMRSAACLVCASRREGYGMVVAEAAAAGTPSVVVAAPESAAPELVEEGVNGRVVPDARPETLAAAIVAVVREGEALRRSTAAWFERHRERMSMAASIAVVQQAYRRELAAGPGAKTRRPRPVARR